MNTITQGAGGTVPILNSVAEAQQAIAEIVPLIRERQNQTEENRLVSPDIVRTIAGKGLFRVVGSRAFGGSEIGVEALLQVTMATARACGSTGWVYGVLAGHSWMLNLFPAQAQEEITANPHDLIATLFRLGGEVIEVDGGYRIKDGFGRFCSGVDHTQWVIVGSGVKKADGSMEPRFLIISRQDLEIIDDWHTLGMRGTGSRSIKVADAFVPAHRSVTVADMVKGTTPGAAFHNKPIYRLPFSSVTPYSIAGAPLGMALGALDCYKRSFQAALDADAIAPEYQESSLQRYARAATTIDAGIALVLSDARRIDRIEDAADFSELDHKAFCRNWSWAIQQCRKAVNDLYEKAGGSAIYNDSEMQRWWRDINSGAQHIGFSEDKTMTDFAREAFGLPAVAYRIPAPKKPD